MRQAQAIPAPRRPRTKLLILGLSVVCVVASGAGIFFYLQYKQVQDKQEERKNLVGRVATIAELPSEDPAVVTVANKSRLQNKQLAQKVQDGDVLLIFNQSGRLIIYRPESQKIIDMLNFGGPDNPAKTAQ